MRIALKLELDVDPISKFVSVPESAQPEIERHLITQLNRKLGKINENYEDYDAPGRLEISGCTVKVYGITALHKEDL